MKDLNLLDVVEDKVNLKGGAIALGHPLGCSNAHHHTLLNNMEEKDVTLGARDYVHQVGAGNATVLEQV